MQRTNLLNAQDLNKVSQKSENRNHSMSREEALLLVKKHKQLAKRLARIEAQFSDINYHDISEALTNHEYPVALEQVAQLPTESVEEATVITVEEVPVQVQQSTNTPTPSYFKGLSSEEEALLKATIAQGFWGDTATEFVIPGGGVETVSAHGYCTNDVRVADIPAKQHPAIYKSLYSKLCCKGNKGEVLSHCSDWWGDGSGDMLFIRSTHVEEIEAWVRGK